MGTLEGVSDLERNRGVFSHTWHSLLWAMYFTHADLFRIGCYIYYVGMGLEFVVISSILISCW